LSDITKSESSEILFEKEYDNKAANVDELHLSEKARRESSMLTQEINRLVQSGHIMNPSTALTENTQTSSSSALRGRLEKQVQKKSSLPPAAAAAKTKTMSSSPPTLRSWADRNKDTKIDSSRKVVAKNNVMSSSGVAGLLNGESDTKSKSKAATTRAATKTWVPPEASIPARSQPTGPPGFKTRIPPTFMPSPNPSQQDSAHGKKFPTRGKHQALI